MDGYESIPENYSSDVRDGGLGFAGEAGAHVAIQKLTGDKALAAEVPSSIGEQIDRLADADGLDQVVGVAPMHISWHSTRISTPDPPNGQY